MTGHPHLIQIPRYDSLTGHDRTKAAGNGSGDADDSLQPAIIWGARGHAKVLNEFLPQLGYQVVAVFDNDPQATSPIAGVPVFHGAAGLDVWLNSHRETQITGLVAIGGQHGGARGEVLSLLRSRGVRVPAVAHPTAFVARDAQIADGCQILATAAVCTEVRIGEGSIVNTGASIDHECVVGAGVHVAPGATIAGCVKIGDRAFIGAGAVVLPWLAIGSDVVIGAGSVVTKDVPDGVVAYGNPAQVVRRAA
ncbi:MAG: acetyltransferase [Planctomycetota bacterium]|nr:acetyltransferase [Planctomycetota bacterium]MDA1252847.1 acetyltransferase [Planctomycetota bacterium]